MCVSIYIVYISVSKSTRLAVTRPHGQLASPQFSPYWITLRQEIEKIQLILHVLCNLDLEFSMFMWHVANDLSVNQVLLRKSPTMCSKYRTYPSAVFNTGQIPNVDMTGQSSQGLAIDSGYFLCMAIVGSV